MTRDEFAAALAEGAAALYSLADDLGRGSFAVDTARDAARQLRAHADLLATTHVAAVADDTWADFERDARALTRALPPPPMLENS